MSPVAGAESGEATVITPPSIVAVLQAGYPVQLDPSARQAPHNDG